MRRISSMNQNIPMASKATKRVATPTGTPSHPWIVKRPKKLDIQKSWNLAAVSPKAKMPVAHPSAKNSPSVFKVTVLTRDVPGQ